jgi:para-aminobenzoate synthetase/4-amino-4-deoxychorismate lyase
VSLIDKNEVLLKSNEDWLHFTNPYRIISVTETSDVRNALREVEKLVEEKHWHAAGFISYEAAPAFDDALQVLNTSDFPLLWFGLYPAPQILQTAKVFEGFHKPQTQIWQPNIDRESYNIAVGKVKEYISQGKTYQVNYTMRLNSESNRREWGFFSNLAQTQNKYAAYIDTGRHIICSASPELFFKLNGERIYSRPMKGTTPRGRTTFEDRKQIEWLHNSIKNRAENVMIVDMVRNDLGRIAELGSVRVSELFAVEKHPTLFQMTSTVEARTHATLDEIFSALFPCASITGAPKVSAMKIISELETTPRKIYTGSIGYIAPNRQAQFSVAIRTALIDRKNKTAEYGMGSGIVWDSVDTDEYEESLLKARIATERPQEFSLIETMLWTLGDGYFLFEKHIERMRDSADYFNFPFSRNELESQLNEISRQFNSPQRVRVLLDKSGRLSIESTEYLGQKNFFKVCLAEQPVNSNNPFLFHKTTQRDAYPPIPTGFNDVLLHNESGDLTEFTIGNLVAEMDGELLTPPISCGLLSGTFRSHLLETGKIKERVIHKDDMRRISKLFLINSVRKWVEVLIQEA